MDPKRLQKLQDIANWEASKPTKDKDWAEDVKKENLDVKFDHQLDEMLWTHADKLNKIEKDLEIFTDFPQVKIYELTQQFKKMFKDAAVDGVEPVAIENKTLQEWIDEEFESQQLYYTWKLGKLNQSVERIAKEIELRATGKLEVKDDIKFEGDDPRRSEFDSKGSMKRSPIGTTYYIDADNGNNASAGTSTGAAWDHLDQFTENARSAGDIAILRGGMTDGYDNGSDLNFTSDGTIAAPIIITADYGDAFGDHVDTSGTATATVTYGSKTITCTADVSGVIAAGDIIYISGDDNTLFSYEVASVSTSTITLYLPYKGGQAGSSKTIINMQNPPHWQDSAASDFQWNFDGDLSWKIQGLHIRGTDANGNVEIDSSDPHEFIDCIFEGNGTGDSGIEIQDDRAKIYINKCRFYNHTYGISPDGANGTAGSDCYIYNSLFNGNSVGSSLGIQSSFSRIFIEESEFANHGFAHIGNGDANSGAHGTTHGRNLKFGGTAYSQYNFATNRNTNEVFLEDYNNTIGDSRQLNILSSADGIAIIQSETTTVRSGGSNKSIKVTPHTNWGSQSFFSKILLFEIPIYASTDSKTYEVYFKTNDTTNWTNDPTASELWIELEAWGHASNNYRKITKSTGTIDFNGSTSWQALSVTVAPAQAGVAYLRAWYAKTKETPSNVFYVDPLVAIT